MTQRILEINSPLFVSSDALEDAPSLPGLFDRPAPLALEIGCGIGDFMVQRAAQQPGTNFLAIDIYNKGCLKTCRRLEKAGLDNVRVLRVEARYLLSHYCAPGELAAVYINCPDPWPKKRHRKRRLVNGEFLQRLLYYLAPNADFYFATDIPDYAAQVADLLARQPAYRNRLEAPWTPQLAGYPVSKYMRRFLDQGQPIHFLHAGKDPDWQADPSLLPGIRPGFRVRWSLAGND